MAYVTGLTQEENQYGSKKKVTFTATAGQTVFTPGFSYIPGSNVIEVYINGVKQASGAYVESQNFITLSEGVEAGDIVEIVADVVEHRLTGEVEWLRRNYGPYPSDPTTRPNGDARVAGDEYFNTTTGKKRFFNGSIWMDNDALSRPSISAVGVAEGKTARVVAFVLRNEGSGWYAIDDTGHVPLGLSDISIVNGALNLNYDFNGSRVISFIAAPDERVSSWGVTCGSSVGQNAAQIYFYGPLSGAVTNAGIQYNTVLGHNITQTVNAANGTISVTHPAISHTAGNGNAVTLSDSSLYGKLEVSATKLGFDLKYTKRMDMIFSWPLGNLAVTSNVVGVSAVWDASGYIQVTHPNTGGIQQVTAQETNAMGSIHARVSNVTSTGFRIYFYNTSGTQITTASSTMVPYCTRDAYLPAPIPSGAVGYYNRNTVTMDAANFVTGSNGNIWVLGLIETDL